MRTKTLQTAVLVAAMVATAILVAALVASSGSSEAGESIEPHRFSRSPPPRAHAANNVTDHGGPVLSKTKVHPVLWGAHVQFAGNLTAFYGAVLTSAYYDWLVEYDTATQTIGRGSATAEYTDAAAPAGQSLTDAQIQTELARLVDTGAVAAPDPDALYMVHFPPGVTISDDQGGTSCQDFCAYHGSFTHAGHEIYYGVIPDQGGPCSQGCAGDPDLFNDTTAVASHELVEATTDPSVDAPAWVDDVNGEIGDLCVAQLGAAAGYVVQLEWSQKRGACIDHDDSVVVDGFSLAVAPGARTVAAGGAATFTVSTAVTSGNPASVAFDVAGLPAGAAAAFSAPSAMSGGSVTLTITAAAGAAPSTSTLTITGTAASSSESATATLTITGAPPAPGPTGGDNGGGDNSGGGGNGNGGGNRPSDGNANGGGGGNTDSSGGCSLLGARGSLAGARGSAALPSLLALALAILALRRRRLAASLLVLVALAAGCAKSYSHDSGLHPSLGGSDGAGAPPDPCTACVTSARTGACASPVTACDNDSRCTQLAGCFLDCAAGDGHCQSQCQSAATPAAVSELDAIGTCICGACSSECSAQCGAPPAPASPDLGGAPVAPGADGGTTPPPPPPPPPPPSGDPCDSCAASASAGACAQPVADCQNDPDCAQLDACYQSCDPNDGACAWQCDSNASPQAAAELDAVGQCLCNACASVCQSQCS